jgi:hypothetical protein
MGLAAGCRELLVMGCMDMTALEREARRRASEGRGRGGDRLQI